MVNVPSIDKKRLKWQGARLAASSVIIGCIVFVLVDVFPVVRDTLSSFYLIGMAFFAILASIFSLPFSLLGGYTLGWLLEKTQWYKSDNAKVIGSGVIIATVTMIAIMPNVARAMLTRFCHFHEAGNY